MTLYRSLLLILLTAITVNAEPIAEPDVTNLQKILSVETSRGEHGHLIHKVLGVDLNRTGVTVVINEGHFNQRPVQYRLIQLCLRRLESARRFDRFIISGEKNANPAEMKPGEVEFRRILSCKIQKLIQ